MAGPVAFAAGRWKMTSDDERAAELADAISSLEEAAKKLERAKMPRSATDGVSGIYARKVSLAVTHAETALLWAREAQRK